MRAPRRCLPLFAAAAVPAVLLAPAGVPAPASATGRVPLAFVGRPAVGAQSVAAASGCSSRSDLLSSSPVITRHPATGLALTAWNGTDGRGHEVRLTVAQADVAALRLAAVAAAHYGDARSTTDLVGSVRGAVAGINGGYFAYDWSGLAVPDGPVVVDGRVLRLPLGASSAVGTDTSGRPVAAALRVQGEVRLPPRTPASASTGSPEAERVVPIASINDDGDGSGADRVDAVTQGRALAVVTPYLGRARPWRDREVVVRHGVVVTGGRRLSFGTDGTFGSGRAGRDDVLLAGDGPAARTLSGLARGSALRVRYVARTADGTRLVEAIGSGAVMLRHGRDVAGCASSGAWSRPRTLVAWNGARTRIWLLTVDGRGAGVPVAAYGATYRQVTELARALGATDAVMLDGGGSTTMALRGTGGAVRRIDAPETAPQRPVPDGLVLIPR